ncbi:hypothetical protein [Armatimonas rosea]|uniref:Uncharacterized protein n=1 Tax=Armatimonas rosea TaxID=685828 RepID=A0A7W9W9F1_ARMRO|nr:hypothetical protein [Armatimonas rosea]MBB6052547.1 hypothetical protein [Armatimonas rosea]
MYGVDDFVRAADTELRQYDAHAQRFDSLRASNAEKQAGLRQRLIDAQAQLADASLPDGPTAESVQRLADQLGAPALVWGFQEVQARGQKIAERLAQLTANPQFAERDIKLLRLETELREVEPLYNEAKSERTRLQSQPGVLELIRREWGTPRYPHRGIFRFLKSEFLRDWKNADAAVAALKARDFAEIAQRHADRVEQESVLGERVLRLKNEQEAIQALVWEHEKLTAEQADLPRQTRARLGEDLAAYATVRGTDKLPDPEAAKRATLALDGITHQISYLEQTQSKIDDDLTGLLERAAKLRDEKLRYETDRYRYRNKSFSQDQWDKRFGRTGRYQKLGDRYERVTEVVYVYDDYYRPSLLEEFLWWDVITDGRIDGNFIPEVAEYREVHPDYAYERPVYDSGSSDSSWDRDDS